MSRVILRLAATSSVLLWSAGLWAAEDKVEKLTGDQTQAQYQRKSITYLGIAAPGVVVTEEAIQAIEPALRKGIELKRFDYNTVDVATIGSIDQFVQELRAYVEKRAYDRASADAEYEARFKRARVYATDVDRIMNSAYFYTLKVTLWSAEPFTCPDNKFQAILMKCIPGTVGVRASVNATATFYKANLLDKNAAPYTELKTISGPAITAFQGLEGPPLPPLPGANASAFEAFKQALAAYTKRLPELQKNASLEATRSAAASLSEWLSKEMKQIPDFQLLTPVVGTPPDRVEFMLGDAEGVDLDDTYDVNEFDVAGKKDLRGYVKVRKVGDATGGGQVNPSSAERIKEKGTFAGGELLIEHPMIGLSIGVSLVFEYSLNPLSYDTDGTEKKVFPGIGFYVDKDIAKLIKSPEVYFSVEGDYILLGELAGQTLSLGHAMLGLKKKWYAHQFVASLGVRGGVSYYSWASSESTLLGYGGDLVLGLEYYIRPEFSLFLKAAGRFFTKPEFGIVKSDPEMGANGMLGAFLAF